MITSNSPTALAAPFNLIFSSREEANWSFDQVRSAIEILVGTTTFPDAPKTGLCFHVSAEPYIILNYYQTLILKFYKKTKGKTNFIEYPCGDATARTFKQEGRGTITLAYSKNKKPVGFVSFKGSINDFKQLTKSPHNAYMEGLTDAIKHNKLRNDFTNLTKYHNDTLLKMVYDLSLRNWHFHNGLKKKRPSYPPPKIGTKFEITKTNGTDCANSAEKDAISTDQPFIDLIPSNRIDLLGNENCFREDGVYIFNILHQHSSSELDGLNLAIRDSAENKKQLRIFERTTDEKAQLIGYGLYLSHRFEKRADLAGLMHEIIVFEIEVSSAPIEIAARDNNEHPPRFDIEPKAPSTLEELRRAALRIPNKGLALRERRALIYYRSNAVKKYVLMRASGRCEGCGKDAPFINRKLEAYLEPHHTLRLADGGPDHPAHVIALCPNCHREVHHGVEGEQRNSELVNRLMKIESN